MMQTKCSKHYPKSMDIPNEAVFAKAEMLIRRPVSEVFEAFTDPGVTTKFWFTKSSGTLVAGQQVEWTWEMYGVSVPVLVKALETNQHIHVEWGNYDDMTSVTWNFKSLSDGSTFISITNSGFSGDGEQLITQIRNSTEGFTLVLAGLKAYLEHGIQLNLVADRFPHEINE